MNSGQARVRLVQVGAALAAAALVAGCGNNYRPVITPINPTGPAPQPSSYAVVVSAPSPTTPGIATIIDYSGDSVMAQAPVGPGPTTFTVDTSGSSGYTVNSDHTMTNFPVSSNLQEKNVDYTTLPTTANLVNVLSLTGGLWVADLDGNIADLFAGSPETFVRSIPLAPTPVMIVGTPANQQRNFGISQGNSQGGVVSSDVACNLSPTTAPAGEADGIEVSNDTISSRIPLGQCPVYAVESNDGRRLFVLNRGGDSTNPGGSITVINVQNNTPDSCIPFQNQAGHWVTCHPSIALPAGPVYAEFNATTQQLVVANYDSNTISIIDVSLDEYGNDYNSYANDNCMVSGESAYANCGAITGGFGTTFTVPVGNNPASVTVLNDGSRAYTANQADSTVTVVNLSSHTAVKTLAVTGYPRTVVSTQNSTQGKVYVASPNSPYLTIIRTDLDIVDTTVLVEGDIVDVRVSTQNAVSGNSNSVSRIPGHGQPCDLPPAAMAAKYTANYTLLECQAQP
jgi:DNA-binding beta-propeller fold protein YncE